MGKIFSRIQVLIGPSCELCIFRINPASQTLFWFTQKQNNILKHCIGLNGLMSHTQGLSCYCLWVPAGCFLFIDISDDEIGVQIAGVARKGEANAELLLYLRSILNVKKNDIYLQQGSTSRNKTIKITTPGMTADDVKELMTREMEQWGWFGGLKNICLKKLILFLSFSQKEISK